MTWEKLGEKIAAMAPAERSKPVQFREPYDDQAEIYELELVRAKEDIHSASDDTGAASDAAILKGEWYLVS